MKHHSPSDPGKSLSASSSGSPAESQQLVTVLCSLCLLYCGGVPAAHLPHGASAGDSVSNEATDTCARTNTWTRHVTPGVLVTAAVFLQTSAGS